MKHLASAFDWGFSELRAQRKKLSDRSGRKQTWIAKQPLPPGTVRWSAGSATLI
jgi:hypothetical protein